MVFLHYHVHRGYSLAWKPMLLDLFSDMHQTLHILEDLGLEIGRDQIQASPFQTMNNLVAA